MKHKYETTTISFRVPLAAKNYFKKVLKHSLDEEYKLFNSDRNEIELTNNIMSEKNKEKIGTLSRELLYCKIKKNGGHN